MDVLQAWHWWLLLALGLAAGELIGTELFLLALGGAALFGALAAWLGADLDGQLAAVAAAGLVLVPLCIVRIRRHQGQKPQYGTLGSGAESGLQVQVIEHNGVLGIRHRSDFLPVRRLDGQPCVAGDRVRIERIEGISAIVTPVPPQAQATR